MRSKEPKYRASYWKAYRARKLPYKLHVCTDCGVEFLPRSGPQKRCDACRTLTCKVCGVSFISKNARREQKYCSLECKAGSQEGAEPEWLKNNRGKKPRTYHLRKRPKHGGVMDVEWRTKVFERDSYTCRRCGSKGRLQAHYIKPFKKYPELRHSLENGLTLCIPCHKATDSYGWSAYWKKKDTEIAANKLRQEILPL